MGWHHSNESSFTVRLAPPHVEVGIDRPAVTLPFVQVMKILRNDGICPRLQLVTVAQ